MDGILSYTRSEMNADKVDFIQSNFSETHIKNLLSLTHHVRPLIIFSTPVKKALAPPDLVKISQN